MKSAAVIAFLAVAVAACQPSLVEPTTSTEAPIEASQDVIPTQGPATPTDETAPPAAPTSASPATAPAVKHELVATDPSTVELASGQPTLLEFFAFW